MKEVYETVDAFIKIDSFKQLPFVVSEAKFLQEKGFRSICVGLWNHDQWEIPQFDYALDALDLWKSIKMKKSWLVEGREISRNRELTAQFIKLGEPDEIDVLLSWDLIKQCNLRALSEEVRLVRFRTDKYNSGHIKIKGIMECPIIEPRDMFWVTDLLVKARFDFVKTGTGRFGGTLPGHIMYIRMQLARSDPEGKVGLKAAGGIRGVSGWRMATDSGADIVGMSKYRELVKELEG